MNVRERSSIVAKVAAGHLDGYCRGSLSRDCLATARAAVPVIGAYLLTAIVAGGYLGRSTLIDDEVNELVVRVTPPAPEDANDGRAAERPRNVLLRRGRVWSVAPPPHRTAAASRAAPGGRGLPLANLE